MTEKPQTTMPEEIYAAPPHFAPNVWFNNPDGTSTKYIRADLARQLEKDVLERMKNKDPYMFDVINNLHLTT